MKRKLSSNFERLCKRSFVTIGLSITVAATACFLTSCKTDSPPVEAEQPGITSPVSPVDPVDPESATNEPSQTVTLEQAQEEYGKIVENIVNANSLSVLITVDGVSEKLEIQDDKMIVTNNGKTYYETQDGVTYVYIVDENGDYTKTVAEDEISAGAERDKIIAMLENVTWTGIDENGRLTGFVKDSEGASVTCAYDAATHSVSVNISSYTVTISKVNSTEVTLPSEYTDTTKPAEEFKITEENYEAVMAAARTHVETINLMVSGKNATLQEIYDVYLTKSEGSDIVDTIGAVYSTYTGGSEFLKWVEMTIPGIEELTFEGIYNNAYTYSRFDATMNSLFSFATSRTQEANYSEMVDALKSKVFEDYKTAEWTGWRGTTGTGADNHTLVMYNNHKIYYASYDVSNDYTTLSMTEAIYKNFLADNPNYTIRDEYILQVGNNANRLYLSYDKSIEQSI